MSRSFRQIVGLVLGTVLGLSVGWWAARTVRRHVAPPSVSAGRTESLGPSAVFTIRSGEPAVEAPSFDRWMPLLAPILERRALQAEWLAWAAALEGLPVEQFPAMLKFVREREPSTGEHRAEDILLEVWAYRSPRTLVAWWRGEVGAQTPPPEHSGWVPVATLADPEATVTWASETCWLTPDDRLGSDELLRPALATDPLVTLTALIKARPQIALSSTDAMRLLEGATTWEQCTGCLCLLAPQAFTSHLAAYYRDLFDRLMDRALAMDSEATKAIIRSQTDAAAQAVLVQCRFRSELKASPNPAAVATEWVAHAEGLPDSTRLDVIAAVWPEAHIDAAVGWLRSQGDSPALRRCHQLLANRFIEEKPEIAVSLVEAVPDAVWRGRNLADLFASWARHDAPKATAFFKNRTWDETSARWLTERMALYTAGLK